MSTTLDEHERAHRELDAFLQQWRGVYSALRVIQVLTAITVGVVTIALLFLRGG